MNSSTDLYWLLHATVPVNGYVNGTTPLARGIVWLYRHATRSRQRVRLRQSAMISAVRTSANSGGKGSAKPHQ